jgi:hypothetical protein
MTSLTINEKARDAIQRVLGTNDFTEKRKHLNTAIFRLQPDRDSKMRDPADFGKLIEDLLRVPPAQLESDVLASAEQIWQ